MSIRRVVPNFVTDDLQASRAFYVDALGLEVAMDEEGFTMLRSPSNATAQLTLWKLAGITVASALFTDAGMVTNTWSAVNRRSIRPSAGMALRWLLPIGALSIEYALPLAPRLGDNPRGRFHLAVALRY